MPRIGLGLGMGRNRGGGVPSWLPSVGGVVPNLFLAFTAGRGWNAGAERAIADLLTVSRASDATFIGSNGVKQTASSNVLRYQHTPGTGVPRGALFEGAQTNVGTNSGDLTTGATATRCTVVANQAAGPFGTATLEKILEDMTTSNSHFITKTVSVVSGTQYHWAAFARAGEWPAIMMRFSSTHFPIGNATFNLSTGVVTPSGTIDDAYMIDYGGGLWLCVVVATATTTASSSASLFLSDGTTTTLSGEDGTKGAFAGEISIGEGYPTSYVPAGASAATRSADSVTIPVAGFAFNAAEGTIIVSARTPMRNDGVIRYIFALDDGTNNNRIIAYRNGTGQIWLVVTTGGVAQTAINLSNYAVNAAFKLAIRYRANDVAISLNGASPVVDASATIPTVTTLRLGRGVVAGTDWNSTIALLGYFNAGRNDADLQALAA